MLAAFDIGNSCVSVGVFRGQDLRCAFTIAADLRRTSAEYALLIGGLLAEAGIRRDQIHGAAIASVVPPLTGAFELLCDRLFGVRPLTVGSGARTGMRVATHNPREVGPDRVVAAVAAHDLFGGPAIVVDLGTATSFDAIGVDGSYLGSAIAPGVAISADALFEHTARLPRVDLCYPTSVVGKDTAAALQAGILFGHVAMVEGMVARIQVEFDGRATVVATGDAAPLIAGYASGVDRVEPHLTLIGLRLIFERNSVSILTRH